MLDLTANPLESADAGRVTAAGRYDVVVAGHICVDVIPTFGTQTQPLDSWLIPGGLTTVGPALAATGGAVSNTGIALYRLGEQVRLMGKVGGDLFGKAALELLHALDPALAAGMILAPDEPSSYTIVINPPGIDRIFLHCPGPNDTFGAADVPLEQLAGARLFHFGYPPIMRRMFTNDGAELEALLRDVRARGLTTSLDMCQPDPGTEAGRVDWLTILRCTMPHVDFFEPSIEEIVYMLERPLWDQLRTGAVVPDGSLLSRLSSRLLEMGVPVVLFKLGDRGLYLRTTPDRERLEQCGPARPADLDAWCGRELYTPCFRVQVGGTTGAGDCTIAGFLAGVLHGLSPEEALTGAVAVGACSVEVPDATSGVPRWEQVQARVQAGWQKYPRALELPGWVPLVASLWAGPADKSAAGQP